MTEQNKTQEENLQDRNNYVISVFPECPQCSEGALVPFSFKEDVFEKWKCTKCGHTIRKNP